MNWKSFQNEGMYWKFFQNEGMYWKLFQNEGMYWNCPKMKECIRTSSKIKDCIRNCSKMKEFIGNCSTRYHSYDNGTRPTCYTSYVKPMIMSKFGKTLQNTCFTIKQMKKQQKLNFHDNPKHEATKSSNSGPRKKLFFLTFRPVAPFSILC